MAVKKRLSDGKDALMNRKDSLSESYGVRRARLLRYLEDLGRRRPSISALTTALDNFIRHQMTLHSGNFAYSAFLGVFPLIFVILAIVGILCRYNPQVLQSTLDFIKKLIPDFGTNATRDMTDTIVQLRNVVGIVGIIGLLWSVSRIAYAIDRGFTAVFETRKQGFLKKKLFAFGVLFLVGFVGLAGLAITYGSSQLVHWIDQQTGPFISGICIVIGAVLSPAASFLIFATIYRVIPRTKPGYREIFWGALLAAVGLAASEYVLSFYFKYVSKYQALYGSLGVVVGIVLWLYMVGILIFFGAELVRALQVKRGKGSAPTEAELEEMTPA
jgi:membrane protein